MVIGGDICHHWDSTNKFDLKTFKLFTVAQL